MPKEKYTIEIEYNTNPAYKPITVRASHKTESGNRTEMECDHKLLSTCLRDVVEFIIEEEGR